MHALFCFVPDNTLTMGRDFLIFFFLCFSCVPGNEENYLGLHTVFFRQSQFVLHKTAWCVLLHLALNRLEAPSQTITPWRFLLAQTGE